MMLVYCYSTGRFSSRVIEEASWCDVAVRYICAGTHPDHDTICTFRRVNRKAFEQFFVHVLEVAAQSGVLKKVGTVSVDGTKIHANAIKHSAVSYARAQEMLERLENEVAALTEKAEQCYEAQATVETQSMLIVSNHLRDRPNDKLELLPSLDAAAANGFRTSAVLADTGYYSEANVGGCRERDTDPYLAVGKQSHGIVLETILGIAPARELPGKASAKERMAHKLKSPAGAKRYGLRKQTVEPVFEIIKQCMRFRQFLMRGKENVAGEWNLVCTAYNLKRTFNLIRSGTATALSADQAESA